MSKAVIFYALAGLFLVLGALLLTASFEQFAAGAISPLFYAARGAGPLLLAIAMLIFARQMRAKGDQ